MFSHAEKIMNTRIGRVHGELYAGYRRGYACAPAGSLRENARESKRELAAEWGNKQAATFASEIERGARREGERDREDEIEYKCRARQSRKSIRQIR